MDEKKFLAEFVENVDGFADSGLTLNKPFADFPQWDSLAVLVTIAWVAETCQVALSGQDVRDCKTLGELHAKVRQRKG